MSGVKRYHPHHPHLEDHGVVLASDYDRDVNALSERNDALEFQAAHNYEVSQLLLTERDELRSQVEAMRAALEDAAKGILWLQASVPMSLRISKRASKDYNAAKRAALQAKP